MRSFFIRLKQLSPAFYYCGVGHLMLYVLFFMIAQFDNRQLMGVNVWIKPMKFALSIGIYSLTWPLLLQYLPFEKAKRRFTRFSVFALSFEMLAIGSQAARGQLSHFNQQGLYNIVVYALMGLVITAQTFFALYMGYLYFKVKAVQLSPALLWSIRLAILITGIFALEGGLMGSRLTHTVGAADGGPGLPYLNWSRVAGDLRIAHFMGLHALQVLPLFVVVSRLKTAKIVIVFAVVYFVLASLVFYNALLGRPLF